MLFAWIRHTDTVLNRRVVHWVDHRPLVLIRSVMTEDEAAAAIDERTMDGNAVGSALPARMTAV